MKYPSELLTDVARGSADGFEFVQLEGIAMALTKIAADEAFARSGAVARLPLYAGIMGAAVWIIGELGQLVSPGSSWIEPAAGIGIIGTALLPFALLVGQGDRALNVSFFGAFFMTTGAFVIGVMNLLGQTLPVLDAARIAWGILLYELGGAAYIVGSVGFAAGILINGRYNRLFALGIGACAVVIIFMLIAGLPQAYASGSNIVLATMLIALSFGLLRRKGRAPLPATSEASGTL